MLSVPGFRNSYFCQYLGPETIMTISVSIFLAVQKHISCSGGGVCDGVGHAGAWEPNFPVNYFARSNRKSLRHQLDNNQCKVKLT